MLEILRQRLLNRLAIIFEALGQRGSSIIRTGGYDFRMEASRRTMKTSRTGLSHPVHVQGSKAGTSFATSSAVKQYKIVAGDERVQANDRETQKPFYLLVALPGP